VEVSLAEFKSTGNGRSGGSEVRDDACETDVVGFARDVLEREGIANDFLCWEYG